MGFSTEYGYVPETFDGLMLRLIANINIQYGTSYTPTSFQGTNFYKFAYAVVQIMVENEIDTGEIYNKLQDYFRITNEAVLVPRTPLQGLIEQFESNGLEAAFDQSSPGTLGTCVNVDDEAEDYATLKATIIETLALYTVAGLVYTGAEEGDYTFSNGQTFTYKFDLPEETPILLKATITISVNNTSRIFTTAEVVDIIDENITELYALGNDFEPSKYLTTIDLPFASNIVLEYSVDNGDNWLSVIFDADYTDLLTYVKETDIEVIIS